MTAELSDLIGRTITEVTGVEVPPGTSFFVAGLTSSGVIAVHDRLQELLGRGFPVATFFDHPTRRDLAEHLARAGDEPEAVKVTETGGWTPGSRRDLRAKLRKQRG